MAKMRDGPTPLVAMKIVFETRDGEVIETATRRIAAAKEPALCDEQKMLVRVRAGEAFMDAIDALELR